MTAGEPELGGVLKVPGDRDALTGLVSLSTLLYTLLGILAVVGLAAWRDSILRLIQAPRPFMARRVGARSAWQVTG
jgi:hypothetical protein